MFTGIVKEIVTVKQLIANADNLRVTVSLPVHEKYVCGDSILLNGICSTVIALDNATLVVEYMPQTIAITTVKWWRVGTQLNCEAPLTLQAKLSGGLVTGHIDTIGYVQAIEETNSGMSLTISLPESTPPVIMEQGAITLDGVNLTIASTAKSNQVVIYIIPHTFKHTIIRQYAVGDRVNIEFDYIAKLVQSRFQ